MKSKVKFVHFHSRKCIWKYRLWNGIHFVQGETTKWQARVHCLQRCCLTFIGIPIIKIRWSHNHIILIKGILYLEIRSSVWNSHQIIYKHKHHRGACHECPLPSGENALTVSSGYTPAIARLEFIAWWRLSHCQLSFIQNKLENSSKTQQVELAGSGRWPIIPTLFICPCVYNWSIY